MVDITATKGTYAIAAASIANQAYSWEGGNKKYDPAYTASKAAAMAFLVGAGQFTEYADSAIAQFWAHTTTMDNQLTALGQKLFQEYQPMATTATAAIAQLRALNGLAPMNPMSAMQNQMDALNTSLTALGGKNSGALTNINSLFNAAKNATTDDGRTAALAALQTGIGQATNYLKDYSKQSGNTQQIATLQSQLDNYTKNRFSADGKDQWGPDAQSSMAALQSQISSLQAKSTTAASDLSQLSQIGSSTKGLTAKDFDAMSADDLTKMVEAQPGYQFQYQQGQHAVQAAAAASGMLYSTNDLNAVQQQGQNTALGFYQQLQGNLTSLANQTLPFYNAQISTQGQIGAAINTNEAAATNFEGNTDMAIAQAQGGAYNQIGSMFQNQAQQRLVNAGTGGSAAVSAGGAAQVASINAGASTGNAAQGAAASNQNSMNGATGGLAGSYIGNAGQTAAGYQGAAVNANQQLTGAASGMSNDQIGSQGSYY